MFRFAVVLIYQDLKMNLTSSSALPGPFTFSDKPDREGKQAERFRNLKPMGPLADFKESDLFIQAWKEPGG